MNKKKALGLLLGIGFTLFVVNIIANRATEIVNTNTNNASPPVVTTETLPPVISPEDKNEQPSATLPDGMVEYTVLVARSRISPNEIFSLENIEAVKQSFPENTERSNLLIVSEDDSLDAVFERIKGYKPQSPLRPKDIIYISRVNYDDERVLEEDLTRIWLSLDQRVRFSSQEKLTLIHLERGRSATGGEIVKIREALKDIPIIYDPDKGGAYLQFPSKNQKDFAQQIIEAGGLFEIDMKTTAQVRRLSCGTETCIGTISQFPELSSSNQGADVLKEMIQPEPVIPSTSPATSEVVTSETPQATRPRMNWRGEVVGKP